MTHPDITDATLRKLFAAELWTLRLAMRQSGEPMNSEFVSGVRNGMDVILRRLCNAAYMELLRDSRR